VGTTVSAAIQTSFGGAVLLVVAVVGIAVGGVRGASERWRCEGCGSRPYSVVGNWVEER